MKKKSKKDLLPIDSIIRNTEDAYDFLMPTYYKQFSNNLGVRSSETSAREENINLENCC